jgi:UDP-glucose 6-dehydrogenase
MRIGICGLGIVGNAIDKYLNNFMDLNLTNFSLIIYDKYKNLGDLKSLFAADMIFICLPTLYEEELKSYDMSAIDDILLDLSFFNYKGIIVIKSTILPSYLSTMNKIYPDLRMCHNPEFLSASTAVDDFAKQNHIVLGFTALVGNWRDTIRDFYETLFPFAKISVTTSECSALMKLACNSFYATKVQYFTELFLLCEKMHIPYTEVKTLMLKNDWINPMHTQVPGSDGQVSFGGSCLPKDLAALNAFVSELESPHKVLQSVIDERKLMRVD